MNDVKPALGEHRDMAPPGHAVPLREAFDGIIHARHDRRRERRDQYGEGETQHRHRSEHAEQQWGGMAWSAPPAAPDPIEEAMKHPEYAALVERVAALEGVSTVELVAELKSAAPTE